MASPSIEGPTLQALYCAEDGVPGPRPPAREPGWSIALAYDAPEPAALRRMLAEDVTRGLEAAWISLHGDLRAGARGPVPIAGAAPTDGDVARLVATVGRGVALHIDAGLAASTVLPALLAARGKAGPADAVLCDPLATLASTGGLGVSLDDAYAELGSTTRLASGWPSGSLPTILADAVPAHDAGASAVQEIAVAIAAGLDHLRRLEATGVSPELALRHLVIRMAVGGELLIEVAKLRAVRRLWAHVRAHAGLDAGAATPVWVRSSWRSSTRRDPWVNLLRGTVAGLSAVLGGATVVAVQPFTEALGVPDADARRWAINTQHILRGEAHLGAVDDPTAGSWTFEALTDQLAAEAWATVQRWLAEGGLGRRLQDGVVQAEIAERAAARAQALATGAAISTGTNLYPQLDERLPTVTAASPATSVRRDPAVTTAPPLARRRGTEPFEALRERSDAVTARSGQRPRAGLQTVGDARRARPQLDFARNVVQVGGLQAVRLADDDATPVPEDLALVVLCAPADALQEHGPAAIGRLRRAGVRRILVAGRPTDALREAGVDDFVHRGRDLLALWSTLHAAVLAGGRPGEVSPRAPAPSSDPSDGEAER